MELEWVEWAAEPEFVFLYNGHSILVCEGDQLLVEEREDSFIVWDHQRRTLH